MATNSSPLTFAPRNCSAFPLPSIRWLPWTRTDSRVLVELLAVTPEVGALAIADEVLESSPLAPQADSSRERRATAVSARRPRRQACIMVRLDFQQKDSC